MDYTRPREYDLVRKVTRIKSALEFNLGRTICLQKVETTSVCRLALDTPPKVGSLVLIKIIDLLVVEVIERKDQSNNKGFDGSKKHEVCGDEAEIAWRFWHSAGNRAICHHGSRANSNGSGSAPFMTSLPPQPQWPTQPDVFRDGDVSATDRSKRKHTRYLLPLNCSN